jgi:hypothetical protein
MDIAGARWGLDGTEADGFYAIDDPDTPRSSCDAGSPRRARVSSCRWPGFCGMLEDHRLGVIRWHHSRISDGLLEGWGNLIQAARRRARATARPQLHRDDLRHRRQAQRSLPYRLTHREQRGAPGSAQFQVVADRGWHYDSSKFAQDSAVRDDRRCSEVRGSSPSG